MDITMCRLVLEALMWDWMHIINCLMRQRLTYFSMQYQLSRGALWLNAWGLDGHCLSVLATVTSTTMRRRRVIVCHIYRIANQWGTWRHSVLLYCAWTALQTWSAMVPWSILIILRATYTIQVTVVIRYLCCLGNQIHMVRMHCLRNVILITRSIW